ncbi:MAG: P1 family peptidase [Geodermatophilaceae bacterium]|nr:P1 family peptidase [Geodermatophilaceae bacterium]
MPVGPTNSLLDVAGVGLGHATVVRDEPPPPAGRGIARTGVTVIDLGGDAWAAPIPAGGAVLNGAGECTGFLTVREWGLIETPIFLTSTMQVGRVYDAACRLLLAEQPAIADDVIIPVVAECDDSHLNDCRAMQVEDADVAAALAAARASTGSGAAPEQGSVGAGTGMICLGFSGGIGTSSRVTAGGHTVGVLLLTNFGSQERLTVDGVRVGRLLPGSGTQPPRPAGSCIGVAVTDAAVDSAGCARLARRIGLGLARTGSTAHHGSGEIFLGVATGLRAPRGRRAPGPPLTGAELDSLFDGVVEATEEAVLASLVASPTILGRDGNSAVGLPVEAVRRLLGGHRHG